MWVFQCCCTLLQSVPAVLASPWALSLGLCHSHRFNTFFVGVAASVRQDLGRIGLPNIKLRWVQGTRQKGSFGFFASA